MVSPRNLWKSFFSSSKLNLLAGFIFFCGMIALATILLYFLESGQPAEPKDPLEDTYGPVVYVNLLYRHGARNVDSLAANDPYRDLKYWPEGRGELTQEGIMQHVTLGRWIAQRYRHLMPKDWRKIGETIRVVSTDWNRTLMSAQAEMAGMFPIRSNVKSWPYLSNYLVPIHSIPEENDALLEVTKTCKRLKYLVNATQASPEYLALEQKYIALRSFMEEHSGTAINNFDDYQSRYSEYLIEETRGYELPDWVEEVYPWPLVEPTIWSFVIPTWTDSLKRLRGGPFVKEVLSNFRAKLNEEQTRSISMYSAHDTTIAAFLNSMGVYNYLVPPFASLVMVELRKLTNDSDPTVTMWFKNSSTASLLVLPQCSIACPLDDMEKILQPVIPEDWEKECEDVPTANETL